MYAIQHDPRALGVVYTPAEVTEPMARLALEPLLRGRSVDEILALRICDPAIGEGAFLIAARALIAEHLSRAGVTDPVLRATVCVCGVDVDPRAVATARAALGSTALLEVADALAVDWHAAFPAVFARGGFDAIIGNPPYIRQEHLAAQKPLLRGYASYDGVADLYVYFIELAHRLARPGGRYCLITPNKWLTARYARALRCYLAAQNSVDGILDLGRSPLFRDADAFPCILSGCVTASAEARDTPIRAARLGSGAALELDALGEPHPRARFAADPWHIDAHTDRALIDRLSARWPPLRDVVAERPARGVVTGYNRAFILDRATRARLLDAEPAAAAVIRPFVKGRDLRAWLPGEPARWILLLDRGTSLDDLPTVLAHLATFRDALAPRPLEAPASSPGRKPGSYRWYELQDPVGALVKARTPRLLYQDIQTGPLCCLDRTGDLVPDTTVWMLPTDDLYLLALLNSPLYGWYARRRFPPALNGSVRPKLAYLHTIPIATPGPATRAAIEQLVTERLTVIALDKTRAAELDAAIHSAVHASYELSLAERRLIDAG